MTTKATLTTGDWFVIGNNYKRWGNEMIKVIKRTPKFITLGVSSCELLDNDDIELYNENKFEIYSDNFDVSKSPLAVHRLKIRTFENGTEYIEVPKSDYDLGHCLMFNKVMRFDNIQEMGQWVIESHKKDSSSYRHSHNFNKILRSEYETVINAVRIAKEKKAVREETVKCLVKKTIIPVEIKQMIMGWL